MESRLIYHKVSTDVIGVALAMLAGSTQAQQVPIPQTAAQVPGPAGNTMTPQYVQMVGRMAYFWGWPLVANFNGSVARARAQLMSLPSNDEETMQ
jgi:hypothetical protein